MQEWSTWPLFSIQLLAFILLVFSRNRRFLGIRVPHWIGALLFLVCILVVIWLIHDSTDKVNLYF